MKKERGVEALYTELRWVIKVGGVADSLANPVNYLSLYLLIEKRNELTK